MNPKSPGKLPSSWFLVISNSMIEDMLNIEVGNMLTNLFTPRKSVFRFLN